MKEIESTDLKYKHRKMQINTRMSYHFTHTRITIIRQTVTNISRDVEKLEPSCIVSRNVKWCSRFGKQFSSSLKC